MLKITRINVNDRISNRKDRVMGILSVRQLGGLLHHLRCLMHPVCSALSHVGSGIGCKRYAYQPVPASFSAPWAPAAPWRLQTAATVWGVRSSG